MEIFKSLKTENLFIFFLKKFYLHELYELQYLFYFQSVLEENKLKASPGMYISYRNNKQSYTLQKLFLDIRTIPFFSSMLDFSKKIASCVS